MEKKEKVVDAASELLSKAKLGNVMKNQNEKAYEDGAFDNRVKHISEKLTKVAHEVSTSTKNTSNRQESLQRTLNQVSGDWKSKAGAKGAKSQGSGVGKSSVSTSNTGSGKNALSTACTNTLTSRSLKEGTIDCVCICCLSCQFGTKSFILKSSCLNSSLIKLIKSTVIHYKKK